jgi:membrane protease YdiL (CAAX protease family)
MAPTRTGAHQDTVHRGLIARRPLLFFFLIAYAGAWIVEAPVVLSRTGTGLLPLTLPAPLIAALLAAATFTGPTFSAFVVTGVVEGRPGVKRLLRRYVQWRVKLRWYLFVLLAVPAGEVLGAIVLPGVAASYQPLTLSMVLSYPLAFVATFVLGGPLGEEPGWRGFALPRLQSRHGPLTGSLCPNPSASG